jgi:imidazolonepropionase-like amidohydrolase
MRTLIHSGTLVRGDSTISVGALVLDDGVITDVLDQWDPSHAFDGEVLDASDSLVMPGLINSHTHGVTGGPFMPSGAAPLEEHVWMGNLDRHLLAGTTTVLNLCGFSGMESVAEADRRHAVNVRGATTHLPDSFRAARLSDGGGLPSTLSDCGWSAESMVEAGAIAIGELGGGQTLGGGGQDLVYIPRAIEGATGVRVSSVHARELKEAALGRFIDPDMVETDAFAAVAQESGLTGRIKLADLRELVIATVMPSVEPARNGIREGVLEAERLGVPAIVHSAAATRRILLDLMKETRNRNVRVIAGHVNHASYTPGEALEMAQLGREVGWLNEVSTFDLLFLRQAVETRDHWDKLLVEPGLVNIMATDYGSEGRHDELIGAIQDVVRHGFRTLLDAVVMATSAAAEAIPGLAPNRGRLERGRIADIVVTNADDFRDVKFVYIDGICVVRNGEITEGAHR